MYVRYIINSLVASEITKFVINVSTMVIVVVAACLVEH